VTRAVAGAAFTGLLLAGAVAAQTQPVAYGRVIDARSKEPIRGAQVSLMNTMRSVTTGPDGVWRLSLPESGEPRRLRVERLGYAAAEYSFEARAQAAPVVITLEPAALAMDAVVVSAARRMQRLADAVVTVELVSRAELAEAGAVDLATVFAERAGLELDAGHPTGAGILMRGFGSERVLVLLDGQPLTGRLSGNFDVARLPASMLERVEIVKGPQSTMYGSDAIGGVVNLITRKAAGDWDGAVDLTGGGASRFVAGLRLQGNIAGLATSLDAGRRRIESTPGEVGNAGAVTEQWDGMVRVSANAGALALDGSLLLVDERQRWRTGQLYSFADNLQAAARVSGTLEREAHRVSVTVHGSTFDHLSRRSNSEMPPSNGDEETQRVAGVDALYGLSAGRHSIDGGVELRHESITSGRVNGGDRSLNGVAGFAQYTLDAGRVRIVPGARASWNQAWGAHLTPRIAIMSRLADGLTLRASAGTAFRAPAFKELYMQFVNVSPGVSYTVRGNPDLDPETSTSFTAGAELARGRWYARGQLFHNDFDDFVETREVGDSSGLTVITYDNIENGTTRGVELETGAYWKAFRGELSYSYLDAFAAGGAALLGSPDHSARALVGYTARFGTRLTMTARYVGNTPVQRDSAGILTTRPGFARFDVRVAQRVLNDFDVSIGVENVFDEIPAHWPGFAGRHLYATVSWHAGQTFRSLREE